MNAIRAALLLVLVPALVASAQTTQPVYETLERAWLPYLSTDDPAQFAMKIRAVSTTPRSYWGGAKDLFFIWAKRECADWLASTQTRAMCHADVHAGNVGTYPSAFGQLSFGLVDFDDAAELPVEIDLLQACISIRLAAVQNKIELDDDVLVQLIEANNAAATSDRNASALLGETEPVRQLMAATTRPYRDQITTYTAGGRFRRAILNQRGELKEILTPAMDRRDELAAALSRASESLAEYGVIKDIARRTRMGSAGSQGLDKVLILTDRDVIIYLKQEIPSAAERTGVVPPDKRSPGERVVDAAKLNCDPDPFINAWCATTDRSYSISLFEPWSAELEDTPIRSADDLAQRARIIGTALGAAHRIAVTDPTTRGQVIVRSGAYLDVLMSEWKSLRDDPRTKLRVAEANAFIESAKAHAK